MVNPSAPSSADLSARVVATAMQLLAGNSAQPNFESIFEASFVPNTNSTPSSTAPSTASNAGGKQDKNLATLTQVQGRSLKGQDPLAKQIPQPATILVPVTPQVLPAVPKSEISLSPQPKEAASSSETAGHAATHADDELANSSQPPAQAGPLTYNPPPSHVQTSAASFEPANTPQPIRLTAGEETLAKLHEHASGEASAPASTPKTTTPSNHPAAQSPKSTSNVNAQAASELDIQERQASTIPQPAADEPRTAPASQEIVTPGPAVGSKPNSSSSKRAAVMSSTSRNNDSQQVALASHIGPAKSHVTAASTATPKNAPSESPAKASAAVPSPVTASTSSPGTDNAQQAIGEAVQQSPDSQTQSEADSLIEKAQPVTLAPRADHLAFSIKLTPNDAAAQRVQPAAEPAKFENARSRSEAAGTYEQRPTARTTVNDAIQDSPALKKEVQLTPQTIAAAWKDSSIGAVDVSARAGAPLIPQRASSQPVSLPATHEVMTLPAETPKPAATGQILLQLGGSEQPATIKVSDRGGSVNVAVHAADPDVRTSLRSNLEQLTSQLSHQGWKTESVRSDLVSTQSKSSQDSRSDGQRPPNQQQSASQDRQGQKDRRSSQGQWVNQFEELLSQNSGNAGGTT